MVHNIEILVELFFAGLWTKLKARSINLQKKPKSDQHFQHRPNKLVQQVFTNNGSIFMEFAEKLRHTNLFTLHAGTPKQGIFNVAFVDI